MDSSELEALVRAVNALLENHGQERLSSIEDCVLRGSLERLAYKEIARTYGAHTNGSLKQAGAELWERLSQVPGLQVKKANCFLALPDFFYKLQDQDPKPGKNPEPVQTSCIGRDSEVIALSEAIREGRRLILIAGLAGSGKTTLVNALIDRVEQDFDVVLTIKAEDIPTPQVLYEHLAHKRHAKYPTEPNDSNPRIQNIVSWLRQHKWLLIVDQTEFLYKEGVFAGTLKDESLDYEHWLIRLSDDQHRSCILWVGREEPNFLRTISAKNIDGLPFDSSYKVVQQHINLTRTDDYWQQLHTLCSGIPSLMRIMANWIIEQGEHQNGNLLNSLHSLPIKVQDELQTTLNRFSLSEQALARRFLIKPLTYTDLDNLGGIDLPLEDVRRAWESLAHRGLRQSIGEGTGLHQLHPPLLWLRVAEQFAESITEELVNCAPNLLHNYPLLQPGKFNNHQLSQSNLLLKIVAKSIQQRSLSNEALQNAITGTLAYLSTNTYPNCYGAGNLINLAVFLDLPLTGWDLSGLSIRHADLRQTNVHQSSFRNCLFQDAVFPEGLTSDLRVALSPDGSVYAIGDSSGHVLIWHRETQQVSLKDFIRFGTGISALTFALNNTLVIALGRNIYFKWYEEEIVLVPSFQVTSNVCCLCTSPNGEKLAVGLDDGQIYLWSLLEDELLGTLPGHTGELTALAFNSDGQWLASCDSLNRIYKWALSETNNQHIRYDSPFLHRTLSIVQSMGWHGDHLHVVEVSEGSTELHSENQSVRHLADTAMIASTFSANGCYLIGSSSDTFLRAWELESATESRLPNVCNGKSVEVVTCAEGKTVLANTRDFVELWYLPSQRCYWETSIMVDSAFFTGWDLQGAQGIPEVTKMILEDLEVHL